jgi:hypothetical protein
MSWVDCKTCGQLRKVMSVVVPADDGNGVVYKNPPCHACGAPEWDQPGDADPYDDQPVAKGRAAVPRGAVHPGNQLMTLQIHRAHSTCQDCAP